MAVYFDNNCRVQRRDVSHRFYTENLFWQVSDKTYVPIESFSCAKSSSAINPSQRQWFDVDIHVPLET